MAVSWQRTSRISVRLNRFRAQTSSFQQRDPPGDLSSGFRAAWRLHGRLRAADRVRQRSGSPAGAGAGSLLHLQRPVGARHPADQQLQVPGGGHPADVAVAAGGVALRQQPGKTRLIAHWGRSLPFQG